MIDRYENKPNNPQKPYLIIFLIYIATHIFLLFDRTIMWDGWQWIQPLKVKNFDFIWNELYKLKIYSGYVLLRFIGMFDNPILYFKLIVFFGFLAVGICLYSILRNFLKLSERNSLFISTIYLILPSFFVKFELALFHYSVANILFFTGVWLYLVSGNKKPKTTQIIGRAIALLFIVSSFFVNSFLVYYYGFLLLLLKIYISKENNELGNLRKKIISWIKNNLFLILLPIIFYILQKITIGNPVENYENYNEFIFTKLFSFSGIMYLIDKIWQTIVYGFFWPIIMPISILQRKIFSVIIIITAPLLYGGINKIMKTDKEENEGKKLFAYGFVLFLLGSLPYLAVGKAPQPYSSGFAMRHALLLPLGSAFVILAGIRSFINEKLQVLFQTIIISILIVFNIFSYFLISVDNYKQIAIIDGLSTLQEYKQLPTKGNVVFIDESTNFNWLNRNFSHAEYTGYLAKATQNTNLKGMSLENFNNLKTELIIDESADTVFIKIISNSATVEPTVMNWLRLKNVDLFNHQYLISKIKQLLGINLIVATK